ncbi:oxidoreductase [Sphingobium jiangsuense]|uniref:Putative oxidoreductase n=1 Tax=Sphingobium jiangsuense TaxID=870476 RepID=A0A7W6BLT2_9SPHN|nr:SDR family NAD(P)-dependent oxidoreductase [Sphingobium jiangsuense]MBB3925972.1 putative oxidoreductase [Sphingobium jiangsuense]GLS98905.1 oxidoreductase [Sphingobium jiangsuense]
MRLTGHTIFITGGSSGIGRALAEQFHARGNQVIIGGRRASLLADIANAHPGMAFIPLDIGDPDSIAAAAARLLADFPKVNMLINAAGIQQVDDPGSAIDDAALTAMVGINFIGTVRMTSALIEHFKRQDEAAILHVSSMLGYLPLSQVSIYCATKAALHSFTLAQRYALRDTHVRVREIIPPYVQTDLLNGKADERAMPLDRFIHDTMDALAGEADEVIVPGAQERRNRLRGDEIAMTAAFNDMMGTI